MKYITDSYREGNLRKLADYLWMLPEEYQRFRMEVFSLAEVDGWKEPTTVCSLLEAHQCGSVGCAVGHGPLAGIGIEVFDKYEGLWNAYCDEVFIERSFDPEAWDWCFSSDWSRVDNTPQGAAKRILWLLDKGLPDDWESQMCGKAALCYV